MIRLFMIVVLALSVSCATANKAVKSIEAKLNDSAKRTMIEYKVEQDVMEYATDPWIIGPCKGNKLQRSMCEQMGYYSIEQKVMHYIKIKILIHEIMHGY